MTGSTVNAERVSGLPGQCSFFPEGASHEATQLAQAASPVQPPNLPPSSTTNGEETRIDPNCQPGDLAALTALSPKEKEAISAYIKKNCEEITRRFDAAIKQFTAGIEKKFQQCPEESQSALQTLAKKIEEMETKLNGSEKPQQTTPPDSPGKVKILASSIKKMFRGLGFLVATSLAIVGGVGFLTALCTGQIYALPVLALMAGLGYVGVSMLTASEHDGDDSAQAKPA